MFGDHGVREFQKDLEQLHVRKLIKPRLPRELTDKQKIRSLSYPMFLKEKRYESIKGRGCANGRTQQLWMKKYDTTYRW